MPPARRTALFSVIAAAFLIALKLAVGLATNSLGFLSEALHSGTDLVAALLTFFAIGVASRPADETHGWGHGKAEHLSALAECAVLAVASVVIGVAAVGRLLSDDPVEVEAAWWAFAVLAIVVAVDLSRMAISRRAARRHQSAALAANALHFAGDLAGTLAVTAGLILTRAGIDHADAAAALFVGLLVLVAAVRMARVNIDVLMDHTPAEADLAARRAIAAIEPSVTLHRLRMRHAGGRNFAEVVIAIPPAAAVADGHAATHAVSEAIRTAVPNTDVVVHMEPGRIDEIGLRDRVRAAALSVPEVREIHNVRVFDSAPNAHVSLHLKLPHDVALAAAHTVADTVEEAIRKACPQITHVTTHLEPLDEPVLAEQATAAQAKVRDTIAAEVLALTGLPPRALLLSRTSEGLVAFVDIALDGGSSLSAAHEVGGTLRARLRAQIDELVDVVVHTEPRQQEDPRTPEWSDTK